MIWWQLGLKLRVVGVEPQVFVYNVDAASDGFLYWAPDFLAPLANLGGDGAGIEESIGIVGSKPEAPFRGHVADDEFVIEEEIKLAVTSRDQIEGADIVGEALEDFGSYPSCPEGVASRHAVFDSDVQLLDDTGFVVVGLLLRHGAPPSSSVPIVVRPLAAVNR